MSSIALTNASILTPHGALSGHALLLEGGRIAGPVPDDRIPAEAERQDLGGGWLLPGYIDTQVNGGGDVLLNDAPTVDGIRAIAEAHRRFGTTALLPTLISDDRAVLVQAMDAVEAALEQGVPGVVGLHIEGPYLNPDKHGIHDAGKFRRIDDEVIALLSRPTRGKRLVTIAPELAPPGAIAALRRAGVIVAAGHSMADYDDARRALREGLSGFTHLFNAMTGLQSRAPGMVGAALEDRASMFGLIVDGVHVHPATLRVALAARGLDGAMLVTDAMPPVGGVHDRFTLMGQEIHVADGTCRGPDGTLAGSALSMAQAVRNAVRLLGLTLEEASRLASANPARFLGLDHDMGGIQAGARADLVHLDADLGVRATWIGGARLDQGE